MVATSRTVVEFPHRRRSYHHHGRRGELFAFGATTDACMLSRQEILQTSRWTIVSAVLSLFFLSFFVTFLALRHA